MTRDLFWFAAGVLATLAGLVVAWPLLRPGATGPSGWRSKMTGAAAVLVVVTAVAILYRVVGTPAALEAGVPAAAAPPHARATGDATAPSLEAATTQLAARLAAGNGSPEDWELLARAYEQTGRDADAAAAWADAADAAAARAGGSLAGAPAASLERALALEPKQPKALWLRATLAYQQKRYADAVGDWVALRDALPPDSPDQPVVTANLEESARLAGVPVPVTVPGRTAAAAAPAGAAKIVGTVDIAPELRARAAPGAALFIYAREAGAAGPPLAVLRVAAAGWPVSFSLDDGNAMVPGRNLSSASRVVVEARVSASGNALPASGDLVGTLAQVDPRSGTSIRVRIDRAL